MGQRVDDKQRRNDNNRQADRAAARLKRNKHAGSAQNDLEGVELDALIDYFGAVGDKIEIRKAADDRENKVEPRNVVNSFLAVLRCGEHKEDEENKTAYKGCALNACFPVENKVNKNAVKREGNEHIADHTAGNSVPHTDV